MRPLFTLSCNHSHWTACSHNLFWNPRQQNYIVCAWPFIDKVAIGFYSNGVSDMIFLISPSISDNLYVKTSMSIMLFGNPVEVLLL